jgi:hypothetical protein
MALSKRSSDDTPRTIDMYPETALSLIEKAVETTTAYRSSSDPIVIDRSK